MLSKLKVKSKEYQEKVLEAPKLPGVYLYLDNEGTVIYVGKAKNLRNRVKSYFSNYEKLELKRQNLIDLSVDINLIVVDSEAEALILENNLIKKYDPKYNVLMRDDKNYIYVRFEKVRRGNMKNPDKESVYQDFPRIKIVRNKKKDGAEYFGPYPDSLPAIKILKRLRRIFPYRIDKDHVYIEKETGKIVSTSKKPSLYYHLGLDLGTSMGFETKEEYLKRFNNIRKFFKGEKNDVMNMLKKEMELAVKSLDFEKAAKLRDRINDIKYITANIQIDNSIDDIAIEDIRKKDKMKSMNGLVESLGFPHEKLQVKPGFRIECYDISNIQGTNAVGAMSVIIDGKLSPDHYRRFRIRMKNEPNDFAMLQEVLARRFRNLVLNLQAQRELSENDFSESELPEEIARRAKSWKPDPSFSEIPDLIIIDGGKGQLASTYKILYQFGLHETIPIVGLAKKEEEIFKITDQFKESIGSQINDSSMFTKIILKRRSSELLMVQRIRDEAHRFGINYHRLIRSKKFLQS